MIMILIIMINMSSFAGESKEGHIHNTWPGVHWRLWNSWREILVKLKRQTILGKIFLVKIFPVNIEMFLAKTKIFLVIINIFLAKPQIFLTSLP